MKTLAERLNSFRTKAADHGLRVHVHAGDAARPMDFVDKAVIAACVAAGIGFVAIEQHDQQARREAELARRTSVGRVASPQEYARAQDEQLRQRIRWVDVKFAGGVYKTPDPASRLMLAKAAAERADLHSIGLSYKDVYGLIAAETSWIPRMGKGKNGVASQGIAQFEPATARGVGLQNPDDPIEAVHAAARHMREAAQWSHERMARVKLTADQRVAKLREGVSVYYNLSTRGRNEWRVHNTGALPRETIAHIQNAKQGASDAGWLEYRLLAGPTEAPGRKVEVAGLAEGADRPVRVTIRAVEDVQASLHPAAQALRAQVSAQCAPSAERITSVQYNSACILNRDKVDKDALDITKAFPGTSLTLIGEADRVPVLLLDHPEFNAGAAVYQAEAGGEFKPIIVVASGLVEGLKGPHQAAALAFMLGHELGHLKANHRMPAGRSPGELLELAANEQQADYAGFQYMVAQGYSIEEIEGATQLLLTKAGEYLAGEPALEALNRTRQQSLEKEIATAYEMRDIALGRRGEYARLAVH